VKGHPPAPASPARPPSAARRAILDEVQRAPDLLTDLQVEVDRHRAPGRFVLTGSHNLLAASAASAAFTAGIGDAGTTEPSAARLVVRGAPGPRERLDEARWPTYLFRDSTRRMSCVLTNREPAVADVRSR
jgi:hypothetical protein